MGGKGQEGKGGGNLAYLKEKGVQPAPAQARRTPGPGIIIQGGCQWSGGGGGGQEERGGGRAAYLRTKARSQHQHRHEGHLTQYCQNQGVSQYKELIAETPLLVDACIPTHLLSPLQN